tara:strand:+ start:767 stop:1189 length:423 start_codon:yes stop_codon:yes gene_type:complete
MTLEQEFKKKLGIDAYENNQMQPKVYNESYVEWLEAKINHTHSSLQLPTNEETNIEIKRLTDNYYNDEMNIGRKSNFGCSYFTTSDIGSKFKVIKSNQWHNFKLGETVTLKCVTMAEDDEYKFERENDYWYLGFADVEKL